MRTEKPITMLKWIGRILTGTFILLFLSGSVPPRLEAVEYGIAANYVADEGIDQDPSVVFREHFEGEALAAVLSRWEYKTQEARMTISSKTPSVSGGMQSLFMQGSADMYQRLLPGYDQLYIRFYAKFEAGCQSVGHWVWLGGRHPSLPWPWPEAGTRPEGDDRWTTGVEPMGSRWCWDFYTYWPGMRSAPGGDYWGNTFSGRPSPWPVPRDEWVCVEFMVKMNDPVSAFNGEQAFWINGEKMAHIGPGFPLGTWIWDGFYPDDQGAPFEGFRWRTVEDLNINYVWLEHYVPQDPDCGCWFDDLVIAKKYIGPIPNTEATIYVDQSGWCNGFSPCFSSIQEGIDCAADQGTVKILQGSYPEHITLQEAKDLTLDGGWDATFAIQGSTTRVQSVTVGGGEGTVIMKRLTIE
ncbi:MAG: hypothetical protein ACLFUT_00015 [Desulfobacteraceae bacterium]